MSGALRMRCSGAVKVVDIFGNDTIAIIRGQCLKPYDTGRPSI